MTRKIEDQARWLADKFASQDKKIASLQTRGELAYSSIEDGAIVEKDLDGNLVASVGKQHDGSHVAVPYTGPTPAAPVAASLKAVPGVVEVRWSGKFTGDAVSAMDFKHVSVHVSTTPAVDATPNTQVATIRGELGDVATVTAAEGMLYVVLVAWSTAGKASAPSPVAAVAVPGAVDEAWIQDKLDDIDERYDGIITDAGNLGTRLSAAEQDLTAAQGRLTDAESDLTDAFGQIGTVDGKATAAAGAASAAGTAAATAQGKADTAKTAADQAAADALAAAGLAGTKGKTLIQPTAPGAADRNNVTLWIDTTAGANTPKRWTSGTTWVAVTDKVAMDAGSTAASAAAAAAAAQSTANAAQTAAGTAGTNATAALTMAGSKSKVYYSTDVATGTGTAAGDLWRQRNESNEVIAEWQWSGTGWIKQTVSGSNVSNMDIGFLTAGAATMSQALINKLVAGTANFQTVDVKNLFATTGTMAEAVIAKLWTDVVNSRKITTQMLAVGSFDNLIPEPDFSNGGAGWVANPRFSVVDGQSESGGSVGRVSANGTAFGVYAATPFMPCEPGSSYRMSARLRPSVAVAANAVWIYPQFLLASGGFAYGSIQAGALTAGTWTTLSGIFTAPANVVGMRFAISLRSGMSTGHVDFSLVTATRANAGELTVDGTVTARALESELVLTTKVVAGDPAATHAEMSPLGFKVFASPAGGGTPTEVVRMGVASSDDYFALSKADGSLAATISQDGVISSAQSNVSDALYYKGEELTGILDRLPGGMVAWGKRTTASKNPADTSTRQPFLRVDFPARKGRAYRITTTPIWSSGNGTGAGAYIRLNYRDDGGVVSAFSDMLSGGVAPEQSITNAWEAAPLSLSGMIYPSKDVVASVMISFQGMGTGTVHLNGNVNYPICIFVDDVGPLVSDLGQYLDGNGTSTPPPDPPIKQSHYKEYTLTGASSYQGNGSYYAYNESKMYQGLSPAGAGNLTSIACFQSMTGDLAGATITGMRVYLYFEFWYYNAGGTAYLGLHGHSTPPATFSHSVSGFTASSGWPRPGGRWINIPSAYWAGFKSGAYKGISLQAPGGDYQYYGFASENAIISASYTK